MLNLFELVHYPNFFFVQLRPYATSFKGPLLSLTLMSKSKKALETCLDLTPSFKTSIDARVEGLQMQIYKFINFGAVILFKRKKVEKDVCRAQKFSSLDCNLFCTDFSHRLNSFYYFFIFYFKGLSSKTQFKIKF